MRAERSSHGAGGYNNIIVFSASSGIVSSFRIQGYILRSQGIFVIYVAI